MAVQLFWLRLQSSKLEISHKGDDVDSAAGPGVTGVAMTKVLKIISDVGIDPRHYVAHMNLIASSKSRAMPPMPSLSTNLVLLKELS